MACILKEKTASGENHAGYVDSAKNVDGRAEAAFWHSGDCDMERNELLRGEKIKCVPEETSPLPGKAGIICDGHASDDSLCPELQDPAEEVKRLLLVMRRLRAPDGCPWDKEQTHETLKECMIGEVAEYLDAVNDADDAEMREELGDVLMQVVMNSVIAEERGAFGLGEVARDITDKMIRRHPHVFGNVEVADTAEVLRNWDAIKKTEKGGNVPDRKSALDRIPRSLPALFRAQKMQRKAAKHGFDWNALPPILEKIHEEIAELDTAFRGGNSNEIEEEAGDLLFSIVNFLRFRGNDSEEILNRASDKFDRRYRRMEDILAERGKTVDDCDARELDELWNQVKLEFHSK